uniref:Uncharacterized protein n=1 Tax=Anguilla anguilla TaxID=7936 RepID=A0A0E9Q8R2_ANGAN
MDLREQGLGSPAPGRESHPLTSHVRAALKL